LRLLAYAGILIGCFFILAHGAGALLRGLHIHFDRPVGTEPIEELMLGQLVILISAFAATTMMAKVEHKTVADYGVALRSASVVKLFGVGIVCGLAILATIVGLLSVAGAYTFGSVTISAAGFARLALVWILVATINGLGENLAVLGYPLAAVRQMIGFWPAALLLSMIFALAHLGNAGENAIGIGSVFLQALLLCITVELTGTLWLSIGLHAGGVFAEDFLFSLPDSGVVYTGHLSNASLHGPEWLAGGSVGAEASVVAVIVFASALLTLLFGFRRRRATGNE
jgi:membrane protease YdiL (CAAX protease family)